MSSPLSSSGPHGPGDRLAEIRARVERRLARNEHDHGFAPSNCEFCADERRHAGCDALLRDALAELTSHEAAQAQLSQALSDERARCQATYRGQAEQVAQLVKERDEAAWRPHEYHKKHLGGCRKEMYDPKSSPCTCQLEYERIATELGWSQGIVATREAELSALRAQLQGLSETWKQRIRTDTYLVGMATCADQLEAILSPKEEQR